MSGARTAAIGPGGMTVRWLGCAAFVFAATGTDLTAIDYFSSEAIVPVSSRRGYRTLTPLSGV